MKNKIGTALWMDSLRRIADHTLFDHSTKVPSVIYTNHTVETPTVVDADQAGKKQSDSPNTERHYHEYRESHRSTSSESDSTPAKKARKELAHYDTPHFPLAPDFSEFQDQEVEGYPSNLSLPTSTQQLDIIDDLRGLDLRINKQSHSSSTTPKEEVSIDLSRESDSPIEQEAEREPILEQLWRLPRSETFTPLYDHKSSDNTDDESKIKSCTSTPNPAHKFDSEKLARLKETIHLELSKIRLETEKRQNEANQGQDSVERKRKLPIQNIVWDPAVDGLSDDSEMADVSFIKTDKPESEAKRDIKILRKCHYCKRSTANMKNHLAFAHLKENWWGVLGDQTCWTCKDYHPLWKISQCHGFYNASQHRPFLHCRHREFMENIMEDFEIVSQRELVNICCK